MALARKDIHDLNNYLNKITITCGGLKDMLENEPLDTVVVDKLKELNQQFITAFSDMEKAALDASNLVFKA